MLPADHTTAPVGILVERLDAHAESPADFSRRDAGAPSRLASTMSAAREKQPGEKRFERTHSPRLRASARESDSYGAFEVR